MTPARSSDSGNATILVTAIGSLAMLMSFSLFDSFVTEHRNVQDNLAEIRAYWAAIGQINYVLSRNLQFGGCASNCGTANADTVTFATAYLQEIACYRAWSYPEVAANYQFVSSATVSKDTSVPTGHLGENLIRVTFANTGTAPWDCSWPSVSSVEALRTIPKIRPVEFHYCLVPTPSSACGSAASSSLPGYQHVTTVLRPSS